MKRINKTSISLSDDELGILDSIAKRLNISRSDVIRNFILYHGMCGGDMPLTSKILGLPDTRQARLISEIRERAEVDDPARPQSFRKWVKETLGSDDRKAVEQGVEKLLDSLLADYDKRKEEANE